MKAFVEILSGIVRAGPECDAYGKPYEAAVAFSCTDGKTAVMKALINDGKATLAHFRAGEQALAKLGLSMEWERK